MDSLYSFGDFDFDIWKLSEIKGSFVFLSHLSAIIALSSLVWHWLIHTRNSTPNLHDRQAHIPFTMLLTTRTNSHLYIKSTLSSLRTQLRKSHTVYNHSLVWNEATLFWTSLFNLVKSRTVITAERIPRQSRRAPRVLLPQGELTSSWKYIGAFSIRNQCFTPP